MIQINNSNIQQLKVNYVGNRIVGEPIQLSKDSLQCDDLTRNVVGRYLLSGIEFHQLYKFEHNSGLKYNKVYSLASEAFKSPESFDQIADELSHLLYQKGNDKSILGGFLFVVYLKDCIYDDCKVDAIGLFKAESTDMFLKVSKREADIQLSSEQGFALNKLDKGCLIFNLEANDGYRLTILNKSHSKTSEKYWNSDFLRCTPIVGDYLNTQAVLKAISQYIKEQETDQLQKAFLINRSIQEAQKDAFDVKGFLATVISGEDSKNRIQELFSSFTGSNEPIPDYVKSNTVALKKTRLKSVLKLDDNFEIVFHGGENRIETGIDGKTGMKFIKLLYEYEF